MYIFEAHYENMDTEEEITRKIEVDSQVVGIEKECYIYVMTRAYENKKANECLASIEFIAC